MDTASAISRIIRCVIHHKFFFLQHIKMTPQNTKGIEIEKRETEREIE